LKKEKTTRNPLQRRKTVKKWQLIHYCIFCPPLASPLRSAPQLQWGLYRPAGLPCHQPYLLDYGITFCLEFLIHAISLTKQLENICLQVLIRAGFLFKRWLAPSILTNSRLMNRSWPSNLNLSGGSTWLGTDPTKAALPVQGQPHVSRINQRTAFSSVRAVPVLPG
jgi:hypothetical protein